MEMYGYEFISANELKHHGILGMKWGVRRFQNEDGTWTAAGKKRRSSNDKNWKKDVRKTYRDSINAYSKSHKISFRTSPAYKDAANEAYSKVSEQYGTHGKEYMQKYNRTNQYIAAGIIALNALQIRDDILGKDFNKARALGIIAVDSLLLKRIYL